MRRHFLLTTALVGLLFQPLFAGAADARTTLRVVTHSSFDLPKDLIATFEAEKKVTLRLIKAGDAGEMLNKLILSKETPIADVVFGIDNAMLPRARREGLLQPLPAETAALSLSPNVSDVDPQASAASDWLPPKPVRRAIGCPSILATSPSTSTKHGLQKISWHYPRRSTSWRSRSMPSYWW